MSSDVVLSVNNIGKRYEIYQAPHHRLLQTLLHGRRQFYKEFWALRDVSFDVKRGECIGIVGRNGSGKSTLLQVVTGTLEPTLGDVEVNGRVSALLELGSGFNPEFTGRENVYMNGAILGLSKVEMDGKFDDIAAFADIGEFIDQPVKIYSSGMYVRLAFAVAINVDPEILIIDEALAVGDIAFQAKCYRKFKEFSDDNMTIIFVSHDLNSVLKYCDNVIVLDKGSILSRGSSREMVDVYKRLLMPNHNVETVTVNPPTGELAYSFMKDNFSMNPGKIEYGDHQAEIIDWGMFDRHGNPLQIITDTNQVYDIVIRVRINRPRSDLIIAFTIKDIKGTEIAGTNTYYSGKDIDASICGEIVEVHFRQRLPLQNGAYTLNLGCTHFSSKGLEVYHRIYDVLLFEVATENRFVGLLDLASKIEIVRYKNQEYLL
jgi:teichoic acid transport system ATP-binding protein